MKHPAALVVIALVVGVALGCGGDDDPADAAITTVDADLGDADLSDADLSDADLTDADLTDADLSDAAGLLGFLDECDLDNDLCDGSLVPPLFCWDYPSKGPHCTHECTLPEDCEAPSPGCNAQGVCRAP